MDIISRYRYILFLVLIIKGSKPITAELPGVKLLAPFYGSSLYSWTTVLSITSPVLTLPYHSEEIINTKHSNENRLILIFGIAAILVFTLSSTADLLTAISPEMELSSAISISGFPFFAPPIFWFGLIGIRAVSLFKEKNMIVAVPEFFRKANLFF
jgi:hypothetical protein